MMIYAVGDCEFDTSLYVLRRAGQTIPLRPKVFQVLLYLLTHRNRVVTKDDLREAIWSEQFVSGETLESAVRAVRHALGDSGRVQGFIQTLHGHGYRLVAPVAECAAMSVENLEKPADPRLPTLADEEPGGSLAPVALPHADNALVLPSSRLLGDVVSSEAPVSVAEHRQLTVLVCRLLEAAPLASQHDLEALHHVIRLFHDLCAPLVQRFGGQVVSYYGDDALVYFGCSAAHEDDARRAVHLGLEIVAVLHTLQARLAADQASRLAMRIAIHSGPAIVTVLQDSDNPVPLVLGETPRLATRLVALALPSTVLISAATQHLVQGYFQTQPLGIQTLPGVVEPVTVYRVLQATGAQHRLDVVTSRFTPLVGREPEVALLLARWQQVQAGHGQVILLNGEAGIGKSRLFYTLKEHLVDAPHTQLECRSSPYYQNTALYPLIDLIQRMLHWHPHDPLTARLDKLVHTLRQCRLPVAEAVPLLGALLHLSVPDEPYLPLALTPQQQRHKTLDTLLALLLALAEDRPVVLILEDLHWTDPTTLEFLGLLIEHIPAVRFFLLLSGRLEFQPPWQSRSYITQMTLPTLSRHHVTQMVGHITAGKTVPEALLSHIIDKTDGIPLFVEELTKTWLESGHLTTHEVSYELHAPLSSLAIPTTLQGLLMARLDRLGLGKDIAQYGAVLGRSFTYEWLQGLVPFDEATLQQGLECLVTAELLYCRGRLPHASYVFKHALIQDIAYQSLLTSTRQQYHARVAQLIEQRFAATIEQQPELLAHHYTLAGGSAQAIPYWQQAGERATRHSAYVEAVRHFRQGLALLKTLPETPARLQQELALHIRLGPALMAVKGYATSEVEETYSRARAICRQIGETDQVIPMPFGFWVFYVVRGELQVALKLSEQFFRLMEHSEDTALRLGAHSGLGVPLCFLGQFSSAKAHLEQAVALYNPETHRSHVTPLGQDLRILNNVFLAKTLWIMGYAEASERTYQEARRIAETVAHPYTTAFCLAYGALLAQYRGDPSAAWKLAEQVLALADEQDFPIWTAAATVLSGWALGYLGEQEIGLRRLRQGIEAWKRTGMNLYTTYWQALLAEAYARAGRVAEGLRTMDEALATEQQGKESVALAEIYRLQGELSLLGVAESGAGKAAMQAERCFQKSVAIARKQTARSWEIRGSLSLARLWQQKGQHAQAHKLLAAVSHQCTEGVETNDLKAVKILLGRTQ